MRCRTPALSNLREANWNPSPVTKTKRNWQQVLTGDSEITQLSAISYYQKSDRPFTNKDSGHIMLFCPRLLISENSTSVCGVVWCGRFRPLHQRASPLVMLNVACQTYLRKRGSLKRPKQNNTSPTTPQPRPSGCSDDVAWWCFSFFFCTRCNSEEVLYPKVSSPPTRHQPA